MTYNGKELGCSLHSEVCLAGIHGPNTTVAYQSWTWCELAMAARHAVLCKQKRLRRTLSRTGARDKVQGVERDIGDTLLIRSSVVGG
jgi:hypothetical protein